MISFQRREDVLPSALMVLSILVLAGTLAYMLLIPKPSAAANTRAGTSSRRRMVDDIADTRKQTSLAQAAVRTRLWQGDPEAVTATILAQIEEQTGKHSLKLMAFRPDRSQEFEEVTELRFDAQVTSSYKDVHSLMDTLDAPGSKVALRSVQITQSQTAGSTVSATLGLSAFVATDPSLAPLPVNGGRHG
ncbi:MAG: type 4a pilus biogenesis protein PilO [Janthinobacterium lividum]